MHSSVIGKIEKANRYAHELDRIAIDQLSLEVQVSIGVALAPLSSRDPKILFQHADIAMYAAKDRRSGVELYDRSIDHSSTRRLCLAGDLRQAIDGDALAVMDRELVDLGDHHVYTTTYNTFAWPLAGTRVRSAICCGPSLTAGTDW